MLFIVTATVRHVQRGIEKDEETVESVSHIVDADSGNGAESILIDFYEQKSDRAPYGQRYSVSDTRFFQPLSRADIRTS
jgi:hypothetical protein